MFLRIPAVALLSCLLQVKPFDYEHSEMLLYQNSVMLEAKLYSEGLDYLGTHDKQILDRLEWQERKGWYRNCGTCGRV